MEKATIGGTMALNRQKTRAARSAAALLACAGAILFLFSGCIPTKGDLEALQAEVAALEAKQQSLGSRMDQVEKKVSEAADQQKKENKEVLDRVARLGLESDASRSDIQKITGQMEELSHALNVQAGGQGGKSLSDMAQETSVLGNRLARVESFLGLAETPPPAPVAVPTAPAASSGTPATPAVPVVPLPPAPEKPAPTAGMPSSEGPAYQYSKEALDRGELAVARERFTEFLKRFPKSRYADNALFWVGETYFLEKDYQKAILEYQKVIEQFPKGNKVPAALLKQGLAFARLRDTANAKIILEDLISRYPQSPEALVAKKQLSRL
ncbi:MAG: tol-pal system protein YbgF [Thermodesulfobacteriota bacterium]